jgi:hypothetical protein
LVLNNIVDYNVGAHVMYTNLEPATIKTPPPVQLLPREAAAHKCECARHVEK